MISVGALALGYLMMNVFNVSSNLAGDVCTTLFGAMSILTLQPEEVWLCIGLSILIVALFIIFYNRIFAVTFDENFARAVGTRVNFYNLMIAILIADFFVVKKDSSEKKIDIAKIFIWIVGFVAYRLLMRVDFVLGCTILDMAITSALTVIYGKIRK